MRKLSLHSEYEKNQGHCRVISKFLKFFLMVICLLNMACAQSAKQNIDESYKYEDKALELRKKGDLQGAIQEQQKAIELNPKDAKPLVVLAGMYDEIDDWEKTSETAQKAIEIDPNQAWAHHLYGNALRRFNKKREALEQAKTAVRLEPENLIFLVNMGSLYGSLEDSKMEKESYEKALSIDPEYLPAIYNLALVEAEEKNNQKAIELLKKVIEKSSLTNDKERIERAQKKLKELQEPKTRKSN